MDYIVLGEGEETAIALFRALEMGIDADRHSRYRVPR